MGVEGSGGAVLFWIVLEDFVLQCELVNHRWFIEQEKNNDIISRIFQYPTICSKTNMSFQLESTDLHHQKTDSSQICSSCKIALQIALEYFIQSRCKG